MGFPQTEFGSLVQALYGIEEGIARGLWADSSPPDSKGKKRGQALDHQILVLLVHRAIGFHVVHRLVNSL